MRKESGPVLQKAPPRTPGVGRRSRRQRNFPAPLLRPRPPPPSPLYDVTNAPARPSALPPPRRPRQRLPDGVPGRQELCCQGGQLVPRHLLRRTVGFFVWSYFLLKKSVYFYNTSFPTYNVFFFETNKKE